MIKELTKLAIFLDNKTLPDEAGRLYKMIKETSFSHIPSPSDNVRVAAAYPGNLGVMEMFQFQRDASPAEKSLMDKLLNEDKIDEAWEFLKKVTGVDLHDPPGHAPGHSRMVIEMIGDIKIYKDSEWGEYIVLPINGNLDEDGYHTDDLEDAVLTAKRMSEENE